MSRIPVPLFVLAALMAVCLSGQADAQDSPPAPVEASEAKRPAQETSRGIVADSGTVELDSEAILATDQPGTLEYIAAREGDRVVKGEVIAKLQSDVAEAALAVAEKKASSEIDILYAQAAYEVAVKELEKSERANEIDPGNVPAIDIARLELSAERARLQIAKARLDRDVARLERNQRKAELARHTIESPLNGIVTEVFKHPGEAVQQGDPIMHVVNTNVVRVRGFVSVAEAARIEPGDSVQARIAVDRLDGQQPELAELRFEGRVMFVDPTVDLVLGGVRVWARVENPDNLLKAGLPATMTILPLKDVPQTLRTGQANGRGEADR